MPPLLIAMLITIVASVFASGFWIANPAKPSCLSAGQSTAVSGIITLYYMLTAESAPTQKSSVSAPGIPFRPSYFLSNYIVLNQ